MIDLITPFYKPEAIRAFQKNLSDRKSLREEIVKEKDRAFKGSAKTFEVTIIERGDPAKQLNYTRTYIAKVLEKQLKIKKGLKAKETLHIIFKNKKIEDGEVYFEYNNACFNSKVFTIANSLETPGASDRSSEEIKNRIAGWTNKGSGWAIEKIDGHYVNAVKYTPLRGRSYMPLPKELCNSKKGLINLKNSDDKCLLWCLVRHKNPSKDTP